ncbi:hypothetical protein PR202_gb07285 [Eleusine coracana subsp. coracana]|uniref:glutathione transferase n=1 Tax=Eleusine coracana subsp. coracana TaxID=191504 RepID=A0AAV5EBW4_ELECO|nr:hypothetical protein QOZ80_2BG0168360 [Eleusine coracana subsp. coracana]GJN19965.1 hypothetical protein PR202_gb07285 [Eleusine coracana subsp. coracana]
MAGSNGDLKLLGHKGSPFVARVKLALGLKGISYDYVEEDIFGQKSDLLLRSNPVHKAVPVLIHNGKPICESQVIVQYIDEVFVGTGPSLLPADPYDRALARFWVAYIDDKLGASFDRALRAKTDEERNEAIKQTFAAAEALEGGLKECSKGKNFFGGDNAGYVDIIVGSVVPWVKVISVLAGAELFDPAKMPGMVAWVDRFCELDVAKAVLQDPKILLEQAKMLMAKNSAVASNN